MNDERFEHTGIVELFPQENGWYYVRVPEAYSRLFRPLAERGLIAITATVGRSTWPTSLLPMGDGTHFLALPKKVRQANGIKLGAQISLSFVLRER